MSKSIFLVCLMGTIFLSSNSNEEREEINPDIRKIYSFENITGAEDAPVTLIVYMNFECAYCASFENNIVPKLKHDFIDQGNLKVIYRVLPTNTDISGNAMLTSELAACSAAYNRFREISSVMFKHQGINVWENYKNWLQSFTMKEYAEIKECLDFHKMRYHVLADWQRYTRHNIRVTPTVFINNRRIEGIRAYDDYSSVIRDLLN